MFSFGVSASATVLSLAFLEIVSTSHMERRLIEYLQSDYDARVRPVSHPNDTVQVNIVFRLTKIIDIDTKGEIITINGWIHTEWYDSFHRWNMSDYGGIQSCIIAADEIWTPELYIGNSVSETLYKEIWFSNYKAIVAHTGAMLWAPAGIFKLDCPMNVKYFPYDEQTCEIYISNWAYGGHMVNLTYLDRSTDYILEYYNQNNEWDIYNTSVRRNEIIYPGYDGFYPEIFFVFHLRRKPVFYVINIFLPSFCSAVLVMFMFHLPPESGEKIGMGVTVLVAFSVMSLTINEHIPESSSNIPLVLIFICGLTLMATLGIAESVIVLYCFYHSGDSRAPRWIRYAMVCNKCTRYRPSVSEDSNTDVNKDNVLTARIPQEFIMNADQNKAAQVIVQEEWKQIRKNINYLCFWLSTVMFGGLLIIIIVIFVN